LIFLVLVGDSIFNDCRSSEDIAELVVKIKPSIVAVGTFQRTRSPSVIFSGTGFIIGDGLHVVTNVHVLPEKVDQAKLETLAIFVRESGQEMMRAAEEVGRDEAHDVAVLKISGAPLPPMTLGDSMKVREGEIYAFSGYPIGMVLGLYPVTHRAMISAITPIAIPVHQYRQLDKTMLNRLQNPYKVFQLDGTAYPGNSGSPLYDIKSGTVVGVINKVFVQESKEHILDRPSGISYAIPIRLVEDLLRKFK